VFKTATQLLGADVRENEGDQAEEANLDRPRKGEGFAMCPNASFFSPSLLCSKVVGAWHHEMRWMLDHPEERINPPVVER